MYSTYSMAIEEEERLYDLFCHFAPDRRGRYMPTYVSRILRKFNPRDYPVKSSRFGRTCEFPTIVLISALADPCRIPQSAQSTTKVSDEEIGFCIVVA